MQFKKKYLPVIILIAGLAMAMSESPAFSENGKTVEMRKLLPQKVENYKSDGKDQFYDRQTTFRYMNGAAELYRQGLVMWHEIGDQMGVTLALAGLGGVAGGQAHPRRAARLLGAADAQRAAMGATLDPDNLVEFERMVAAARRQLDARAWTAAWAEGQAMTIERAVGYALGQEPRDTACSERTP